MAVTNRQFKDFIKKKILEKDMILQLNEALEVMETDLRFQFSHDLTKLKLLDFGLEFDVCK